MPNKLFKGSRSQYSQIGGEKDSRGCCSCFSGLFRKKANNQAIVAGIEPRAEGNSKKVSLQ